MSEDSNQLQRNSAWTLILSTLALVLPLLLGLPQAASAFNSEGCGSGECRDCHSLDAEEALKLLPPGADKITDVRFSEVGGLWRVEGESKGRAFRAYIDFSKQYLIVGNVIRLKDGADVSHKVNVAEIPEAGAIVLGRADAPLTLHVFSDVRCSHCKTLHQELEKLVAGNAEVNVHVHLLPIMMDKELAAALGCSGSAEMLSVAYASGGESDKLDELQPCGPEAVAAVEAFAGKWQLRSTPSIILPDGQVVRGARPLQALEEMVRTFVAAHPQS